MDLKSDNPYWLLQNGLLHSYPFLENDLTCDVVILGGGISGALIAESLVTAGIECVVLDRRDIGTGSTAATTALLQYEIDTHLVDLAEDIGQPGAERAYRLCHDAIHELGALVEELPDACSFRKKRSLYLASDKRDAARLRLECEARHAVGIAVDYLTAAQVESQFGLTASAALLSPVAAQVDAYRLTHRLFQRNVARGLRVFDRTEAREFEPHSKGIRIRTDRGAQVSARKLVFATGYESQEKLKRRVVSLQSTYAFVTQPLMLSGWPRDCLLWESSRPYIYLRDTDDRRLLMGGEDDAFRDPNRRDASIPRKSKQLLKRLQQLLPGVPAEVDYAWAGTFGETKDGLPYIGESKEFPQAYFGLGFGGNGITFSVIAATVLRDLILEVENPDGHLFRFDR